MATVTQIEDLDSCSTMQNYIVFETPFVGLTEGMLSVMIVWYMPAGTARVSGGMLKR